MLALDGAGLGSGTPAVGARVTTGDPAGADALVGRLIGRVPLPGETGLVHRQTPHGYVVATSAAQAARLSASAAPRLGDAEDFRRALPDLAAARFALWVDVDAALQAANAGGGGDVSVPALAPVRGLGLTASTDQAGTDQAGTDHAGTVTFRLRLVTR